MSKDHNKSKLSCKRTKCHSICLLKSTDVIKTKSLCNSMSLIIYTFYCTTLLIEKIC